MICISQQGQPFSWFFPWSTDLNDAEPKVGDVNKLVFSILKFFEAQKASGNLDDEAVECLDGKYTHYGLDLSSFNVLWLEAAHFTSY